MSSNFKMSGKDFEQLAKFIEKNAKGVMLRIKSEGDHKLEISVDLVSGEEVKIVFFNEEQHSFPKVIRARNLGDEL